MYLPADNQRVLWRINQIINALALVAVVVVLGFLVVGFVRSLVDPTSDRHGYGVIFSAVLGIVALALLVPIVNGAIQLRRRRRAGAVCQVVLGATVGVLSVIVPGPLWGGIAVGLLIAAPAIPLLVVRERQTQ